MPPPVTKREGGRNMIRLFATHRSILIIFVVIDAERTTKLLRWAGNSRSMQQNVLYTLAVSTRVTTEKNNEHKTRVVVEKFFLYPN